MDRRSLRLGITVGTALLAFGCGPGGGAPAGPAVGRAGTSTAAPTAFDSQLLAPMDALPACREVPPGEGWEDVDGLRLPDDAVVQRRNRTGQLTQVLGFVPLTPVQLLDHYRQRDDLTIEQMEHEQWESEILYTTSGGYRGFVKSQVACATGSNFVAVVGSAEAAAAVPTPSGRPGSPSPAQP